MPSARNANPSLGADQLVARAREPILALTADRRIALVNRAWEELTGHAEAEVVGLECRPHGPTRAGDLLGLAASFCPPLEALAGQPSGGKTLIIRRGGERLQRRVEYWPFHDGGGQLLGILGMVRPAESPPQAPDSERDSLRYALLDLRARLFARHRHDALIGQGPAHRQVLDGIDLAAGSLVPVTIVGEAGTGKRFVARLIHAQGARRQMPLLGFDVRAIPPDLLERELFAPHNPDDSAPLAPPASPLVAPEGATVVLGDILSLPRDLQARLAEAMAVVPRASRLIATTEGDLDLAHAEDRLRGDLYHILTTLVIRLPPLRDRLDELPLLAQSFLERANLRGQVYRTSFEPAALDILISHDWPGNLRELAQVVDEAHARANGPLIAPDDLPPQIRGSRGAAYLPTPPATQALALRERLLAFEREIIIEALTQARHNKTVAARRLGVNRPFLYRRIKELEIPDPGGEVPPT